MCDIMILTKNLILAPHFYFRCVDDHVLGVRVRGAYRVRRGECARTEDPRPPLLARDALPREGRERCKTVGWMGCYCITHLKCFEFGKNL